MNVRIAHSCVELDLLRSHWERLYSSQLHTIFQSFAWNRLAAQFFGDREAPFVVYAENSSGAALIPAAIAGDRITFLGETLFDYRDVLVAGDGDALIAAWKHLAHLRLPLRLTAVRGKPAQWVGFKLQPFVAAPFVPAQRQTGEQFAAAHARSGRLVRRLQRLGAELKRHDGSASELLCSIYEHKAGQFGSKSLFSDRRRIDFMLAAASLDPAAIDMYTFETAGAVVAAMVTLRDGGVRRFYTTWFDEAWARYSPGTALLFEVTRQSLAEGLDCDYMTGTQFHKQRFASDSVPLFRVETSAQGLAQLTSEGASVELAA